MSTVSERSGQWMCRVVFHSVTDGWPFHDHLPSKTICPKVLSQRVKVHSKVFPGLLMNSLFKTIFPCKNDPIDSKICLLGEMNNENSEKSLSQCCWQIAFSSHQSSVPRGPEQWMCIGFPCVTNEWPFQDPLLSKTMKSPQMFCR